MRNAFVVLVSLCIGVVSGFIVPSSTPENIDKSNISKPDASGTKVSDKKSMMNTESAVLPKNRTNIDEKYLFEHATEKKNNQSERAYVYLNQKYSRIKHPRNKLIKVADKITPASANVRPPSTLMSVQQIPCLGCQKAFSPVPNYNTKYQGFTLEDAKHGQESILSLAAPELFSWNFNEKHEENDDVLKMQMPAVSDTRYNRINERRDFVELLKKPLLKPHSHKVSYERASTMNVPIMLSDITPNSETFTKGYLKNQYANKLKEINMRQNEMRNIYGFNGAFIDRPYQIEEVGNRAEELSFMNGDENRKNVEVNQEEDGLLDKYLKDSLDDSIPLAHDRVRALPPNCGTAKCAIRKKHAKNKNVFLKPICQCERNLSLKEAEPFISNERSLREDKSDRNETVLTSSEIMNYEEMLSESSKQISEDNSGKGSRNTEKYNSALH